MASTPELIQFQYSHFNEKARWALDFKAVPHRRTNLLPGPHAFTTLRATGRTEVPILRLDGITQAGSAAIIDLLETRYPDAPLYPRDAGQRERALEVQGYFDDTVGVLVRRALFANLLSEGAYVCDTFADGRSSWVKRVYRSCFPLVGPAMKRGMGIAGPDSIEHAMAGTREALDFVAKHASDGNPLVGDAFSVADLAAASLLAPAVMPIDSPMRLPSPLPAVLTEWLERWADHPGAEWVRAQYREHRRAGAAEILPA
jgi:glutathione S-transferase